MLGPRLPGALKTGSSSANQMGHTQSEVVELRGFEPLTFSLRTRRATNCATAPCAREREEEVTTASRANPNRGELCSGAGGLPLGFGLLGDLGRLRGLASQHAVALVVAR